MRKARVHLRHVGTAKSRFGVSRMRYGWGYNIDFGRFFLAIREKRPNRTSPSFLDLKFGKSQLAWQKKWDAMSLVEKEAYWAERDRRMGEATKAFLNGEYKLVEENQNDSNTEAGST